MAQYHRNTVGAVLPYLKHDMTNVYGHEGEDFSEKLHTHMWQFIKVHHRAHRRVKRFNVLGGAPRWMYGL